MERLEDPNPLPLILGGTVGGLVLLALVALVLYKVRVRGWGGVLGDPPPTWGGGFSQTHLPTLGFFCPPPPPQGGLLQAPLQGAHGRRRDPHG